jgi:hypothetical protein
MEIGIIIVISLAISLSVSILIKIAVGVKWVIDVNEILSRRERERSIEYRVLTDWWLSIKFNLEVNKKGKSLIKGKNKRKYKRYLKLKEQFNKGKLQQ